MCLLAGFSLLSRTSSSHLGTKRVYFVAASRSGGFGSPSENVRCASRLDVVEEANFLNLFESLSLHVEVVLDLVDVDALVDELAELVLVVPGV